MKKKIQNVPNHKNLYYLPKMQILERKLQDVMRYMEKYKLEDIEDSNGISVDAHIYEGFCLIQNATLNLEKKGEERHASNLMGLEHEQLNIKAEKIIKKIFN